MEDGVGGTGVTATRLDDLERELYLARTGLERHRQKIAALEEANAQLEELVFGRSLLNRISQVAQDEVEVAPIAGRILDLIGKVLQAPACGILAWDGRQTSIYLSPGASADFESALAATWRLGADGSEEREEPAGDTQNALFIPIRRGDHCLGILSAELPLSCQLDPRQREILELFARELGPLLERGFAVGRAQEAYEARLDFVRDLTHDLRNPLTGILSTMLSLLNPEFAFKPEVVRHLIGAALRSARQLDAMLDDLLDVHRLAVGHLEAECVRVELASVLQGAADTFDQAAVAAGLRLTAELPGDLPDVRADRRLLERVAANLVANALKFTPAGVVRLRAARTSAQWLEVRVEDSGPGIPAEVCEHLFQPYFRGPAFAHEVPGTGLGLAFCKGAVEGMGGRIWVEPSELGGSAFCVALPIWDDQELLCC